MAAELPQVLEPSVSPALSEPQPSAWEESVALLEPQAFWASAARHIRRPDSLGLSLIPTAQAQISDVR